MKICCILDSLVSLGEKVELERLCPVNEKHDAGEQQPGFFFCVPAEDSGLCLLPTLCAVLLPAPLSGYSRVKEHHDFCNTIHLVDLGYLLSHKQQYFLAVP